MSSAKLRCLTLVSPRTKVGGQRTIQHGISVVSTCKISFGREARIPFGSADEHAAEPPPLRYTGVRESGRRGHQR